MPISRAEKSRGSVCGAKGSDRENMLREGDIRMVDDHGGIGNVGTPSDNRMPRDVRITCNESSARDVRRRTDLSVVADVSITLYMGVIKNSGATVDFCRPINGSVAKDSSGTPDLGTPRYDG